MRIDKYLKLSRLVKRRTIAKELLERGIIQINSKVAKPSTEVKVDDVLVLPLGRHKLTVKVLNVVEYCKKNESNTLYEIMKDEIIEDNDPIEFK
jgi:ribosomal 50S subunit-recycling heat shock protein